MYPLLAASWFQSAQSWRLVPNLTQAVSPILMVAPPGAASSVSASFGAAAGFAASAGLSAGGAVWARAGAQRATATRTASSET